MAAEPPCPASNLTLLVIYHIFKSNAIDNYFYNIFHNLLRWKVVLGATPLSHSDTTYTMRQSQQATSAIVKKAVAHMKEDWSSIDHCACTLKMKGGAICITHLRKQILKNQCR